MDRDRQADRRAGQLDLARGHTEQVVDALLDYYDLGIGKFLFRGFDPLEDAIDYAGTCCRCCERPSPSADGDVSRPWGEPMANVAPFLVPNNLARLRALVVGFAELLDETTDEPRILDRGTELLASLIATDDWLPPEYAKPDPARYQQYLLHCDSRERFSVVSFVWGPGQSTPIHDHRVWGLVGVLRGSEQNESFARDGSGKLVSTGSERLGVGRVSKVSPRIGDVHRVSNAERDRASISIHVYGANIGAVERATYDALGAPKRFVSGYANRSIPNFWDRSGAS